MGHVTATTRLCRIAAVAAAGIAVVIGQSSLAPSNALAVVIKDGDGTGNTSPPADDPGVGHVGTFGSESGVYLGNGWVISASHIAFQPFALGGVTYPDVAGSKHRLTTPGSGLADLALYKIDGDPGLPAMNIASTSVALNRNVIMHGHGRNRGIDVTFDLADGWQWGSGHSMRWGTNDVAGINQVINDTQSFLTSFDESGPGVEDDEAQATVGDSGGAVFYKRSGTWELTGIMWAIGKNSAEQPDNYTLLGNVTLAADLATYRTEIMSIINQPVCDDGLDEDGDGQIDYPADPGCDSATDSTERDDKLACDDGIDDDGDGLTDWPADPGCSSSTDSSEQSPALVCDDGIDNEGDGFTDHAEDPECEGPNGTSEGPGPYVPVTSGAGMSVFAILAALAGRARINRRRAT